MHRFFWLQKINCLEEKILERKFLTKSKMLLATLTVALSPVAAQASDISYTNAELGYQMMTGDGSFDGFLLRGSFEVNDDFYIAGGYDELEDGVSTERLSLRGGIKHELEPNLDVYGELGLVRVKNEYYDYWGWGKHSDSETGLQLEGGARMLFSQELEGRAFLRHVNVSGYDETFLGAQGVFNVNEQIGVHGGITRWFDASEFVLEAGVRFNF